MKDQLTSDDIIGLLERMADDLTAQADRLRELDAAIGDGDLGITITLGFEAVRDGLPDLAGKDIGSIVSQSGMAFNRKAASTFGALFATMMMRAGRESRGLEEVGLSQVADMLSAAAEGVRERGKAQVGDKTMLDALVPAVEVLAQGRRRGQTLPEALEAAARAAEEGAEQTKAMKSKMGRAAWFSERTEGIQDPGATAVALMLRSAAEYVTS